MKSTEDRLPDPRVITPSVLREWALPKAGDSKYGRGQVVVLGGARRAPGAVMLAGLASLRVGAGRLTLGVAGSVSTQVAVAVPECGVVELGETASGSIRGDSVDVAATDLASADAVVIGPGLDDPDECVALLESLPGFVSSEATLLLDAFALGVLPRVPAIVDEFADRLILTPNREEAGRLLDRDLHDDIADVREVASRYHAVVSCYGTIAAPDGAVWTIGSGNSGLGTSGSGDVLVGSIGGLAARGAKPLVAASWGTHLHAMSGDRLAARIAPLGYLASELLAELPLALREVES